jgi:protein transport protein SEC23
VAEVEIGQGGTNVWSMGGIDPSTTVAVYFEVTNPANNALPPTKRRFIQVHTRFPTHPFPTRLPPPIHGTL